MSNEQATPQSLLTMDFETLCELSVGELLKAMAGLNALTDADDAHEGAAQGTSQ